MRKILLILTVVLFSNLGYSQLSFSERVKYSNSANSNDKSLFLVDFWATWCGPCVHVSKYLNVLQQQFPEDLYVVSLSYENKDLVENFLKKHPTDLAVSVDENSKNFDNFDIKALPHGILFNASGKIVWRGNPADLKNHMVVRFLKNNKAKTPIANFIKYNAVSKTVSKKQETATFTTSKDYDFTFEEVVYNRAEPNISKRQNYTLIRGTVLQVTSYLMKLDKSQIKSSVDDNKAISLLIRDGQNEISESQIAEKILRKKAYSLSRDSKHGEFFKVISINDNLFWDSKQIDWGVDERPAFMVGDDELSGDNISVETLLYKLSNLVSVPFIVSDKLNTKGVHDWSVHYKFQDLMISNLENLGIKVIKLQKEYPIYEIKKRGSK